MVSTDRGLCCIDEGAGQLSADRVMTVRTEGGQLAQARVGESRRGGIRGQDGRSALAAQAADVASEFREAEVDQAVELAKAIDEMLRSLARDARETR